MLFSQIIFKAVVRTFWIIIFNIFYYLYIIFHFLLTKYIIFLCLCILSLCFFYEPDAILINFILMDHVSLSNFKFRVPMTKEDFSSWLTGCMDADGHITRDGSILIDFNRKNSMLVNYLHMRLGVGEIISIETDRKLHIRLVIDDLEHVSIILDLINGQIRTERLHTDFTHLIRVNPIMSCKPLDTSLNFDNYWLSGFIDCDGSVQWFMSKFGEKLVCKPNFKITQASHPILNRIQSYFGVGGVYLNANHDREYRCYDYRISSVRDIHHIHNYLGKYPLLGFQLINYLFSLRNYEIVKSKAHFTPEGASELIENKSKTGNSLTLDTIKTLHPLIISSELYKVDPIIKVNDASKD
uniref:Putative LAGLIDADG homing endonuclease n=1 Tax=Jenufa minuta TaxID=993092 RepID=A0A6G7IU32_JENMI|nr:putative LAGLIDADG homing endonuclease [Jenufa minuta]QII41641.1 putative LAGLIDADG homing endonuclease [Jenufa minuta]